MRTSLRLLVLAALAAAATFTAAACGTTAPTSQCSAASCSGCCSASGVCEAGDTDAACGASGAACEACGNGAACQVGACTGGTGGGAGGGTGGGTGGTGGGDEDGGAAGGAGGGTAGGAGGGTAFDGGVPPNDTCALAQTVTLASTGLGSATGTTLGAVDDTAATCGGAGGGDVVYRVTTVGAGTLSVTVTPAAGSGAQPVVSVRSACAVANSEVAGACAAASAAGATSRLVLPALAAGDWFILVDSAPGTAGDFTVDVAFSTTTAATCLTAVNLDAARTAPVTIAGSTVGLPAATGGTCTGGGGSASEAIYTFTTTDVRDLRVDVTSTTGAYQPAVYLRAACTTQERACRAGALGAVSLALGGLPAGTYFLFVDGAANTQGGYVMTASLTPPKVGDTCALTQPLAFDGGVATAAGDTSTFFNDLQGSCAGGTAPDVVYSFTTTQTSDLRATVSPVADGGFVPGVYLRSPLCTSGQRACGTATARGGTASLSAGSQPAGTYVLVVDGYQGSQGEYTLTATATAPAAGDTCAAGASALSFAAADGGLSASATGDTTALFNDFRGSCVGASAPDAVYSFTTTQAWDFEAIVTPTTAGFLPGVVLRGATCGSGAELGCGVGTTASPAGVLRRGSLPAGTYHLYVDGFQGALGAYQLQVNLTATAPGDSCAQPFPLALSGGADGGTAVLTGSTAGFFHDEQGSCAGTSPEVVYAFTTDRTLDLRATMTPSVGYWPAVYLRRGVCTGAGVQEAACHRGTTGQVTSFNEPGLPAGTYYLFVDGISSTTGTYSLDLSLLPPRQGDLCAAPIPLSFTGTTATATGTLSDFFHHGTAGNCGGAGSPDAVYSFTLAAPATVSITATAQGSTTFQPVVALQTACGAATTGCNQGAPGGTATLAGQLLQPGTYFVWVDGAFSTQGDYLLTVTAN